MCCTWYPRVKGSQGMDEVPIPGLTTGDPTRCYSGDGDSRVGRGGGGVTYDNWGRRGGGPCPFGVPPSPVCSPSTQGRCLGVTANSRGSGPFDPGGTLKDLGGTVSWCLTPEFRCL